jgi:Ca-activated chloride channel family protein
LSFGHPILLVALLAVPLAIAGWLRLERRRHIQAATWSNLELLPNMVPGAPGRRRYIPFAFFLIGLTLLLAGFARPQAKLTVPREGATVVLALDVSGSMGANDVKPTRLVAADAAITQFLHDLPSKYRTAFVIFSFRATVRVPPTYDRKLIVNALPAKAEFSGTALGDGVATAARVASKAVGKSKPGAPHPPAAVLLLSDGLQNTGKLKAPEGAAQARKLGVPVYTVSLGTAKGSVRQKLPGPGKVTKTTAVPVKSTELQAIARATDGRFFKARSADELKQVYKDLGHRLATENKRREITAWTTMGALGFILTGALLSGIWFRRLV